MKIDLGKLENLARLMEENDLVELEIEDGETMMALEREEGSGALRRGGALSAGIEEGDGSVTVTSSHVGVFTRHRSAGESVAAGDLLGEVRVMDVKYRVLSPVAGVIEEVLVEDGIGVEYGQALFRITRTERN
ncbi:MAG: hypothetical protein D6679_07740 [Candidatus Hydrogenedentota bacterium]|nr:MAG: hypothetical protein D6679_07740 [Candidatus Hydrogenedentota bacterium]